MRKRKEKKSEVIGREGDENGDEKIKEVVIKLIFKTNKKRR